VPPLRLVLRNVLKHRLRFFLTTASLAVAVFLLCVLRSLTVALNAGVEASRSDRLIVQSAVSLFVNLPQGYQSKINAVEGVEQSMKMHWFGGYYQDPSNFFGQFAIDQDLLLDVYPEIDIIEGSAEAFLESRTRCLIGKSLAQRFGDEHFGVGKTIPIIGAIYPRADGTPWTFEVAGIYEPTSSNVDPSTLFFHWDYLEQALEAGGTSGPSGTSVFVLQLEDGANPVTVSASVDALYENGPQKVQTTSEAEFQAQFVSMVGNIPFFVSSIGGGVTIAILLAVLNTMLMAGREQTRDIGVMKALGFSNGTTAMAFILQGLLISLLGSGLGIGLALLMQAPLTSVLGTMFPGYHIAASVITSSVLLAIVVGLVSSAVPAWRAANLDVVDALRMEVG